MDQRGKPSMDKSFVTIENWAVVGSGFPRGYEALQPGMRLTGNVFGHAKLQNMKSIYTSRIISVDSVERVVETVNTSYLLGEPSAEYRRWRQEQGAAAAA
jgi:hypothetical protein